VAYLLQVVPGSDVTGRFKFAPVLAEAEPWRLLTSAFLHSPGQPLHILFNMYALWLTGPYLEDLLGRARFLALYLISAIGGSVGYLLIADPQDAQQWFGGAVGASGAVFGLFAAFLVVQRRLKRDAGAMFVVIAINAALSFLPNVAWQAHLGGLLTGAATAAVLAYAPKANRNAVQAVGVGAIVVVLGLLYVAKLVTAPDGVFLPV
jgi:membrane associated rhomboid family serine protease